MYEIDRQKYRDHTVIIHARDPDFFLRIVREPAATAIVGPPSRTKSSKTIHSDVRDARRIEDAAEDVARKSKDWIDKQYSESQGKETVSGARERIGQVFEDDE